ncbi:hypothetical protein G5714_004375 [Onychostoma macrolepis]|uniref:Uncharacterized protein n=1 Tax=Onychostoma macrolepis TaxID=369639 RepID=A0A7J6D4N1_9TELE|nr:hypothetical protein G5714_004375 [Onychostoma macrolepis]
MTEVCNYLKMSVRGSITDMINKQQTSLFSQSRTSLNRNKIRISRTMGGTASGINVSVVNETPYTWYFATQDRGYTRIGPNCRTSYEEARADACIRIRYGNQSKDSFSYGFNTDKDDTSFILRENKDRSQIQMHCTSTDKDCFCPIPG